MYEDIIPYSKMSNAAYRRKRKGKEERYALIKGFE
jgi:hypothetical protein